jgi:ATPase
MAKRGKIGQLKLVKIRDEPMTLEELQEIAHEILEVARIDEESNIEIERKGATVVQLRDLRIAIAERPFADRMEITAVRPVAKVTLDEYGISEELKKRFVEKQRGILIAGPPGAGKSTFAASVADYLMEMGYIVKTMESPRDLMVRDEITQYAPLEGDMTLTSDILLLVRPDYTIYDELRKTSDFQIFADMRLAGVGMIGVTHATRPIDAVQRLIGRVELGIIPQVVDTIIFIDAGKIKKVYELNFTVKVPYGMTEEDLARPVIEVVDFETKRVEYEIYTYGEQVVVMPIEEENLEELKKAIEELVSRYVSKCKVEVLSNNKAIVKVPEDEIPRLLGRKGRRIKNLEKELKMKLDVQPLFEEFIKEVEVEEDTKHYVIHAKGLEGKTVEVYANNEYLFTVAVSRKGTIRIRKDKEAGKLLKEALLKGEKIYLRYKA